MGPKSVWTTGPPDVIVDCAAQLQAAGVKTAPATIPVHVVKDVRKRKNAPPPEERTCGADQVVVYKGSAANIRYEPAPVVTCGVALALAKFDAIVQAEAKRTFGTSVTRIRHLGSYACRGMAKFPTWPSEHSYANAIDVAVFVLKNGREVTVARHYPKLPSDDATLPLPPKKKEGDFLEAVATRTWNENVFSSVLTPWFNAQHRDHFHLDLARYRINGTRPREWYFPRL